ncbi:hypothetical protein [Streptomyces lydicus]|uniref:hypothetical protein n=1 Tax=Streptomyces lydicus TaxID=47763 RepID=UPI001012541B|nr:hypothetical protein [Streptomyces lydicus]MCZ1005657.1 hypothetical protein [Streptomyces lydicus]
MYENGVDARALFRALHEHEGPHAHEVTSVPWLQQTGDEYRLWLARAAVHDGWWTGETAMRGSGLLIRELYALSRVNDVLLLGFQPSGDAPPGPSWPVRRLQWPGVSLSEYVALFTGLGMTAFDDEDAAAGTFDPFFHEIVDVEQADDLAAPIRITQVVWPGLMLGDLLFSRAGVRVRAGRNHAQRGVADCFPLYWTFRRNYRPTVDESHDWGAQSQWATNFRLDYRTSTSLELNVAGDADIDTAEDLSGDAAQLAVGERRELLRHRCLLRAPEAVNALAGAPGWEKELRPFDWRLPGSVGGVTVGGMRRE